MDVGPTELALDARALLTLIATRLFREIAQAIPAIFVTERRPAGQIRSVRRGGSGPDALDRESIDMIALETDGFLVICNLTMPGELADFVAFALEMDDGEAATGALARAA